MDNKYDLINNIDKLHTTELGKERIARNLSLNDVDVVEYCKEKTLSDNALINRNGKNWYILVNSIEITINITSYTIITAHKYKKKKKGYKNSEDK